MSVTEADVADGILFSFGEMASMGAAVSALAAEIKPYTGDLSKTDREGLARTMIRAESGIVKTGWTITWEHTDRPEGCYGLGDLVYRASR